MDILSLFLAMRPGESEEHSSGSRGKDLDVVKKNARNGE